MDLSEDLLEKIIFSDEDRLNFTVPVEELLSCIRSLSTPLSYLFNVLRGKSYSSLPAASLCQMSQYQAGQQHWLGVLRQKHTKAAQGQELS